MELLYQVELTHAHGETEFHRVAVLPFPLDAIELPRLHALERLPFTAT